MIRALVTGASSPLGAAIATRLAAAGHALVLHAHQNPERASSLARALEGRGGRASVLTVDLTDAAATEAVLQAVLEDGPIQILVHNAGRHDDAPMAGMSAAQWRGVLAVSLDGFFNATKPLLLPMMATRWGRVIALSSVSAITGNRGQANYAAAKAGLIGAVRSLALECASRGVTVNAVAPGIIASPATDEAFPPEKVRAMVPMKRAGEPAEVAELVAFLASREAGYITGQCIGINGGLA